MMWKIGFFLVAVIVGIVSLVFCVNRDLENAIVLPSLITVFSAIALAGLACVYYDVLGKPLTVEQLEKRKLYTIHGEGSFVANGEMKKKVYFVIGDNDPVKAVILPVNLPDGVIAFWVINNRDALGQRVLGEGAILPHPSNEKIPFRWKEKSETKK